jgi:cell division protein FtsB
VQEVEDANRYYFNFASINFFMAKSGKKNFFSRLRKKSIPAWMRNKYFISLTAFFIWMLFFDHNNIISQVQLRMKLSDYLDKKEYYEQQIAQVKKEKQGLLTNQDSLERFAREKYLMKKDNEDLFVIMPEKTK